MCAGPEEVSITVSGASVAGAAYPLAALGVVLDAPVDADAATDLPRIFGVFYVSNNSIFFRATLDPVRPATDFDAVRAIAIAVDE